MGQIHIVSFYILQFSRNGGSSSNVSSIDQVRYNQRIHNGVALFCILWCLCNILQYDLLLILNYSYARSDHGTTFACKHVCYLNISSNIENKRLLAKIDGDLLSNSPQAYTGIEIHVCVD